jgi:flagellar hook-associated protein FlgK
MPIIVSKNGKNAVKLDKISFGLEDRLQQYLYDNPESVPLYDIKEDIRLLILAREFSTESGPIDAVGIDQDGQIYLVETKLYKNPDKRTVVAQVLDYGASLWKTLNDFDDFLIKLNKHVQKKFGMSTTEKIQEYFGIDDEQLDSVLKQMKFNLDEGNFKFVVMMDSIGKRLKDLIIYMNQNSKFDIYGVELEYYQHDTFEIMIPKIFGTQVKKDIGTKKVSSSARKVWDENSFIEITKDSLPSSNAVKIISLLDLCKQNSSEIKWGNGNANGSFSPISAKIHSSISPFTIYSNGKVKLKFSWLENAISAEILTRIVTAFSKEINNLEYSKEILATNSKTLDAEFVNHNFDKISSAIKAVLNFS